MRAQRPKPDPRSLILVCLLVLAACQNSEPVSESAPVEGGVFANEARSWCPEGTHQQGQPPPNGKEIACVLPDGDRHGRYTRWFDTGHIAEDGHFERGKKKGEWTTRWRRSGALQSQGQYAEGEKQGVWLFYSKRGKVKEEALYEKGALVEMKKISHSP